jgi:hypothetical protein
MGGGLMQLVAYGAQDIYLTGNPQITFFKVVYRRHTNFSMEAIQQTLNGTAAVSTTQTCTISRNGDLVTKIWIEQAGLTTGLEGENYDYIDNVEVEIGGQMIDKQHGDWNAVWWNLTTPESQADGFRHTMIGQSGANDGAATGGGVFWYPLNFWFCRNPGLALPLIALQYHEVKLKIKWGSSSIVSSPTVWVDYIYLDTDERRRFAQVSHEYLIEQIQRSTFAASATSYKLNFNHPVKELLWVNDVTATATGATTSFAPMRCSVNAITRGTASPYNNADATTMRLQLNGHDRFAARNMKYFKTVQPLQHHTRCPALGKRFSVVSGLADGIVANGQALYYVSRPVRVIDATITLTVAAGDTSTDVILYVDDGTDAGSVNNPDATAISGTLTNLENVIGHWEFTMLLTEVVCVNAGKHICISIDGANTAMRGFVTLELEELPLLIGGYGYEDLGNIYCYSFALKPEEHQPSGTCNFSRIDNAKMIFGDAPGAAASTLKVFAVNYNVLRIMSGMGGLAYSN